MRNERREGKERKERRKVVFEVRCGVRRAVCVQCTVRGKSIENGKEREGTRAKATKEERGERRDEKVVDTERKVDSL